MNYTLKGDRGIEYSYAGARIPRPGPNPRCLDMGPGQRGRLAREAVKRGWHVTGVDLMTCDLEMPGFCFVRGDLRTVPLAGVFDLVLNVSTIEHVGIPGRYGVARLEPDADLEVMARTHKLMSTNGIMVLTLPVGLDAIHAPFHRIYGMTRMPLLLDGYDVLDAHYWHKTGNDDTIWTRADAGEAMATRATIDPTHYYAIGTLVLRRAV